MSIPENELREILQTSISPVALVSGVGLLLLSMTNRLGRSIDRARVLASAIRQADDDERQNMVDQLRILYKRGRVLRRAIVASCLSILFASVIIVSLFEIFVHDLGLQWLVMGSFAAAMLCLVVSVVFFIRDITLSLRALKLEIGEDLYRSSDP